MQDRSTRRTSPGRRSGAAILVTAVLSLLLVAVSSGTATSAAPVNATIPTSCSGRDVATNDTLGLAKELIGSDRLAVNLLVTGGDVPETAGLEQDINAAFDWAATMDQNLIDEAAALIPSIQVSNLQATQQIRGPVSTNEFSGSNPGPVTITPQVGVPARLPIGTIGGTVRTNGGGIVTYRVGSLQLDVKLTVTGVGDFDLKLKCEVQGSNIIAKTTVRDPDAPVFNPEIIQLQANPGQTVSVDLLGNVITPGKTPLLPESLEIVDPPTAGSASIAGGVLSFTAPNEGGTYSTTVQVCGAPKSAAGTPGVNETQMLTLGENWTDVGTGGGPPLLAQGLNPRPIAFTLKVGEEETGLIWAAENILLPAIFPMPLNGTRPTPENWAPENRPGIVNQYATDTRYKGVSPADVQAALEALPSVGAGNVVVSGLDESGAETTRLGQIAKMQITYVGAKGGQDVPSLALGQWYSVPPQEVLDRIAATIAGLAGSIGGEDDGTPPSEFDQFLETLDPNKPGDQAKADKFLGDKIQASLFGGPAVTSEDWSSWILFKLNIGALIPQVTTFLNSLFPQKVAPATVEQGEAPVPPQPLCAQGIVEVTVAAVGSATTVAPSNQVAGTDQTRPIGFVG